jgi:hypothetical protein
VLGANVTVWLEVTSRLAHEPDWPDIRGAAPACLEKSPAYRREAHLVPTLPTQTIHEYFQIHMTWLSLIQMNLTRRVLFVAGTAPANSL